MMHVLYNLKLDISLGFLLTIMRNSNKSLASHLVLSYILDNFLSEEFEESSNNKYCPENQKVSITT